jgi:2-methylisocitrate lyase-like PEP mutase family enzyme
MRRSPEASPVSASKTPPPIPPNPASGMVPMAELAAAGVRRISLGGAMYRTAMGRVAEAATALTAGDIKAAMAGTLPSTSITDHF